MHIDRLFFSLPSHVVCLRVLDPQNQSIGEDIKSIDLRLANMCAIRRTLLSLGTARHEYSTTCYTAHVTVHKQVLIIHAGPPFTNMV